MRATSSACMWRCRCSRRSTTSCPTACWRKARARSGRCRSRARRERRAVHLLDVQLFGRHGRAPHQARTRRRPAIRPASPRFRSKCWKPRCRSCSTSKELRIGSGGAGRRAAATARRSHGTCAPTAPGCSTPCRAAPVWRRKASAAAATGGRPFLVNGKRVSEARKLVMQPGDQVMLETPGGGGYGAVARKSSGREREAN